MSIPDVCKDLSPECSIHKNVFCAADHPYGQQLCPLTCDTCSRCNFSNICLFNTSNNKILQGLK